MNARIPSLPRVLLAAALLHAPALGAQGLALSPALLVAPLADEPAPAAALVHQGTQALLEQVAVLTEPGRELPDDPVDLPCDRQAQSPELALAQDRPDLLLWRAVWEYRARRTIEALEAPLPICFPADQHEPDRTFQNVITFNSQWLSRPEHRHLSFVLNGYAAPRESATRQPVLGEQRANGVRLRSGANLQRRLTVRNGGVSGELGKARWVEYVLTER